VALTSPADGVILSGIVPVTATASDDLEVFGVRFAVDGVPLGVEDTVAPYEVNWTTTTAANGAHTVTAIARDGAGHQATASAIVTVANDSAPPVATLDTPASGSSVSGIVALLATASDDVGVAGVLFKIDGAPLGSEAAVAPYERLWNTADVANGPHTVTAVARDAAGHETATSVELTVVNDTAPPTVALTNPAAGATLGGVATLVADASDDIGVVGVQFKIDGALMGIDTVAPYELLWNTTDAVNGTHMVTAVALDAAANETTMSAEVAVMNDPSTQQTISD
jgi:hypothetical protein